MKVVYFDKGAFSQLWRDSAFSPRDLIRIRRRFSSRLFTRRPRLLVGPQLVSEIAPMLGRERFEVERDFIRNLRDALYLRPVWDRMVEEVAANGAGQKAEPYMWDGALSAVLSGPGELWKAEVAQLCSEKETFLQEEKEAMAGLDRDLEKEAIGDGISVDQLRAQRVVDWFSDRSAVVEDWSLDFMRRRREELGLDNDESRWPRPRDLPTIWGYHSYKIARIFVQLRDGRGIDANDFPDWGHYTAAMYADEIVVEDRKFRAIIGKCPPPGPSLRSFHEWGEDILGG